MDTIIFQNLYSLTNFSPFFDGLIIFLGKTLPYFVSLYFLFLLYKLNKKDSKAALRTTLFTIIAIAISRGTIVPLIHFLAERSRPFDFLNVEPLFIPLRETAMPSGHATFFFLLATIALFKLSRKSAILLYISATIISFARIVSGAHWPSDILVGAAIGIGTALVLEILFRLFKEKTRKAGYNY